MTMTPQPKMWPVVPHYYGDVVRQLFVAGAVVMLVGAPLYTETLRFHFPFILLGAILFVALAALTNPHNKTVIIANAIAAGVAVFIYETWAFFDYTSSTWIEFGLREIIALNFIAAFYFSMKTLRAMLLGQIGKREVVGEFDTE
ncbi:hypothetical protein C4585_00155 [Candidatus Parcubacteria bacterium]|nr:MAG: hypothetical protein C4585_00155 [Candidatus Parcubacteria bacterium]